MKKLDLSIYQQNFYLEWRMDPTSTKYNTCLTFEIKGPLNVKALKQTVSAFVNHCENQRTYFVEENDQIKQVIVDKLEVEVEVEEYDLTDLDEKLAKKEAARILKDIYHHQFNLHQLPLFRYGLIQLTQEKYILAINFHHIISDAFIAGHLINYISNKYNQLAFGEAFRPDKLPSIEEYIKFEKESYPASEREQDLSYWEQALSDVPLNVSLPKMQFNKKEVSSSDGKSVYFTLNHKTSSALKKLARANRTTPFLVLSSIWALLMSRYSGQQEIILHYPINARPTQFSDLLGCFVNTVLMKVDVDQTQSVSDFINAVTGQRKITKPHQKLALFDIVQRLRSKKLYEDNAFNVSIAATNLGVSNLNLNKCQCKAIPRELQHIEDLGLHFEIGEKISLMIDHNGRLFDDKSITRLIKNFKKVIDQFIKHPNTLLKDLRVLSDDRRKQILIDWNDTKAPYPKNKTIYQLFEEQVKRTPNNTAVVFEDEKLNYKELNQKANQLARLIRVKYKKQTKKELKPDSLIGLCVERSLDMIIGILGILKSGAAYVPLDPDYPQDRLEYMIEDSHEGLIITQKDIVARDGFLDKLHHDELLVIDSDEVKADIKKQSKTNLKAISGPNDLAYVIYTSGSTGKPKGTMLEHKGIINQITWMNDNHDCNENDRVLNLISYGFDGSVRQFFSPLFSGGSVIMLSNENSKDPLYWVESVIKTQVTMAHMVPSMFRAFLDAVKNGRFSTKHFKYLKRITCGAEPLILSLYNDCKEFLPYTILYNHYGPTEASANVSQFLCHKALAYERTIPIGEPIRNTQLYVLDNNLNPCPIGTPGELHIGGVGLARGYLNQEKLTKERFIDNPFAREFGLSETDRIYKTGDLVRWLPDGNIEYLGRTDFQVKIRGFRIELGEIENVLSKNKQISQVCVVALDKEGQKYLAAYYVLAKGKSDLGIDKLRDYLAETLPDYMVPMAFVKLDEMPLTPNGKINRKTLPDPDMSLMGEEYVAPRNEIEQQLADIWCDILKIEKAGINDNFFHLGGNSLLSIRLISLIKVRLNCDISIKFLFDNPQLHAIASHIDRILKTKDIKGGDNKDIDSIVV